MIVRLPESKGSALKNGTYLIGITIIIREYVGIESKISACYISNIGKCRIGNIPNPHANFHIAESFAAINQVIVILTVYVTRNNNINITIRSPIIVQGSIIGSTILQGSSAA
jgi:hypothetical protein